MDTKKLEVLLKAIETGNLTAAGDEMGFTQSGVSHLIKSIENELGFQLLIRGKSGVRLTPDGEDHLGSPSALLLLLLLSCFSHVRLCATP